MRLGVLASGGLGTAMLQYIKERWPVELVLTDRNSIAIIDLCKDNRIPCFAGNPRKGNCRSFLAGKSVDILLSVNYLFIIDKELIRFPQQFAFNIHGSLLPKYRGRTPHVWAIINNEQKTGITAHLIDEGCDTGAIIDQISVEIGPDDTGADILHRFRELYPILIKRVLEKAQSGKLDTRPQDNTVATYFGRRTPDDGLINWNWQKERIRNWVRAQAHPYPGAFSWVGTQKITIDRVAFSEHGFNADQENGLLLSADPLLVKCPNGVIRIESIRPHGARLMAGLYLNQNQCK